MTAPGYYALPLLKEPTWTWEVPVYFFVGGAAGASAVIGAAAKRSALDGEAETLSRDARWIAAAGGALSGALLTADLGRPGRFLNMLRVFKLQSPMSVGAWTLTAFSTAASAAAFADLAKRQVGPSVPVAVIGDAAEMLAAATGLVMVTYTGVLIGATAIPVWHEDVRLLPIHFAGVRPGVGSVDARARRPPFARAELARTAGCGGRDDDRHRDRARSERRVRAAERERKWNDHAGRRRAVGSVAAGAALCRHAIGLRPNGRRGRHPRRRDAHTDRLVGGGQRLCARAARGATIFA